jgi:hypothetical protein
MSSLKRVLLSVTHLASGSLPLLGLLNRNPRVQFVRANPVIQNYVDLRAFTAQTHKLSSVAAIFALEANFNYQLGSKNLPLHAHYLFTVRQPTPVLNLLVADNLYGHKEAAMYYCYRLRRICEIAKRVRHGMLLTYDDIQRGDHVVPLKTFLGLKEDVLHLPEAFDHLKPPPNVIKREILDWCQDCYERHLFFLKSLPLVGVSHG